jgi:hypothetical protein
MANWEMFEEESVKYLKREFNTSNIDFLSAGGKDANQPDILVLKNGFKLFSIETKLSPAQAGQFVVEIQDSGFTLGTKNRSGSNLATVKITDYLNANLVRNKKKQVINIDNDIMFDWVKEHYINKGSRFIITSTALNSFKAIIPIEQLDKYFNISACLRIKNSGSSYLSKDKIGAVIGDINAHLVKIKHNKEYSIGYDLKKKGTYIDFSDKIVLAKKNRYFGNNLFLSPHSNGSGFYIKNLSNTKNSNVIFSLRYKGENKNCGISQLELALNEM